MSRSHRQRRYQRKCRREEAAALHKLENADRRLYKKEREQLERQIQAELDLEFAHAPTCEFALSASLHLWGCRCLATVH